MREDIAPPPQRRPGRGLAGFFTKAGLTLALSATLAAPAAWAGSWNGAQETLNNHPTWIYTPDSTLSNGKHALVIALHGCDQTNDQLKTWGNVTPAAESKAAVIALPYVGSKVWSGNTSAKCWDYDGATDTSSHIAELVALTTTLAGRASLNIDTRHVYIIGLSSGASMALDVACKAPDLFAGVSALAGPSVGSQQFSATSAGSSIFYTAASAAQKCKDLAGTAKQSFFATQIANIAYGEKDKDAESPGCTYSSGSTSCPGTYQLVSKKWSTINVDAYASVYGAGALGSPVSVAGNTGTTAVAQAGGVNRISLTRVLGVGHAWPAGSGQANDVNKGGVWMAQSGMNYADYSIGWLMGNNLRAGIPDVTLNTSVSGTTINYSGSIASADPISSTQAQLYAWNGSSYAASGSPVSLTLSSGNYSASFSVANNNWYQITVSATTTTNRTGSKAVKDIQVGTPPAQWQCNTVTSSNNAHVTGGRAHDVSGYAYANGSNQKLLGGGGLDNLFYTSTLSQTSQNYWVNGTCP